MSELSYTLGEELGRGALGRVVRVQATDGSQYAGKILHASHRGDPRAASRFASEAAILVGVSHENIVAVHGIEEISGEQVMRMELVEGDDLATLIAVEGVLDSARLVRLGKGICAGLGAAHRAGLIHRDLKPQNILLTTDELPKIADFGMARAASFAGVDESAFAVAGTPDYMAPECVDPLAVDSRSDLYSLGCILFELATGRPPFTAATSFALLEAHRNADIPGIDADLPVPLVSLIRSLLAKSPADRPQSAKAVERALADVGGVNPGHTMPELASTGLTLAGDRALAATGSCVGCGQPLLEPVSVCFGCGLARVALEPGKYCLLVDGPGAVGDKIDSGVRAKLLAWLGANPSLGLDTSPLEEKVPRLPFVVVRKRSEASAQALAVALESLGVSCVVRRGGPFGLASMRKKSWILAGRIVAIVVGSSVGLISTTGGLSGLFFSLAGVVVMGGVASGWYLAGSTVTKSTDLLPSGVPKGVAESIARVAPVVQSMELRRHRESLRGVVERVLRLCEKLSGETLAECEADLARTVDLALVASARIDEIESGLATADLRNPSPETLRDMRERDQLAGQLLEVTGFLDAMRIRAAALVTGAVPSAGDEQLEELRAHIAALEEVQAL